jgi:hypothetical protein
MNKTIPTFYIDESINLWRRDGLRGFDLDAISKTDKAKSFPKRVTVFPIGTTISEIAPIIFSSPILVNLIETGDWLDFND